MVEFSARVCRGFGNESCKEKNMGQNDEGGKENVSDWLWENITLIIYIQFGEMAKAWSLKTNKEQRAHISEQPFPTQGENPLCQISFPV